MVGIPALIGHRVVHWADLRHPIYGSSHLRYYNFGHFDSDAVNVASLACARHSVMYGHPRRLNYSSQNGCLYCCKYVDA